MVKTATTKNSEIQNGDKKYGCRLLCEVFKLLFNALIVSVWKCIIFAAQRYASVVYAIGVCLSVCVWLSVTLRILSKWLNVK